MKTCMFCDQPLVQQSSFTQFLFGTADKCCCLRCEMQIEYTTQPNAIYFYNDFMKQALYQFKFLKDIRVAIFFAQALKKKINTMEYDQIIPIPMHPVMEVKRTFSQIDAVLQEAQLPFIHALIKTTTAQQSKKTYEERVSSACFFDVLPNVDIQGKSILLVDDVITTGTTIQHAKKILLELGAKSVKEVIFISGKK